MATSAEAGVVGGRIDAPPAPALPEPQHPGFLKRRANAVLPPLPRNPYIQMAVMLVPTGAQAVPRQPQVGWDVVGESFARPLAAIPAGGEVLIRNRARRQVTLQCLQKPDLFEIKPLNEGAPFALTLAEPGVYTIVDKQSPHLRGTLVVGDAKLIVTPDAQGKFEFKDVPAGTWKVKLFYQNAWVERTDESITVADKGKIDVVVKLPSYGAK